MASTTTRRLSKDAGSYPRNIDYRLGHSPDSSHQATASTGVPSRCASGFAAKKKVPSEYAGIIVRVRYRYV